MLEDFPIVAPPAASSPGKLSSISHLHRFNGSFNTTFMRRSLPCEIPHFPFAPIPTYIFKPLLFGAYLAQGRQNGELGLIPGGRRRRSIVKRGVYGHSPHTVTSLMTPVFTKFCFRARLMSCTEGPPPSSSPSLCLSLAISTSYA